MNVKAGICDDCGQYWTVSGGGLNDHRQCPTCEKKYPVSDKKVQDDKQEDDMADKCPL